MEKFILPFQAQIRTPFIFIPLLCDTTSSRTSIHEALTIARCSFGCFGIGICSVDRFDSGFIVRLSDGGSIHYHYDASSNAFEWQVGIVHGRRQTSQIWNIFTRRVRCETHVGYRKIKQVPGKGHFVPFPIHWRFLRMGRCLPFAYPSHQKSQDKW